MMKSKVLGPTSHEWFEFGKIKSMSAGKGELSFSNDKGTVTAKLGNPEGVFVSYPEVHTDSNMGTIQRVKVELVKGEDGIKTQVTTWEVLFDDRSRSTFQTSIKGNTKYDVLTNPMVWDFK